MEVLRLKDAVFFEIKFGSISLDRMRLEALDDLTTCEIVDPVPLKHVFQSEDSGCSFPYCTIGRFEMENDGEHCEARGKNS